MLNLSIPTLPSLAVASGATTPVPSGPSQIWSTTTSSVLTWNGSSWQPPASGGSSSGVTISSVNIDLGSKPVASGNFTITGSGFIVGKTVIITQSSGPATNAGTIPDAVELDQIQVTGYVLNSTTIQCYWGSVTYIAGYYKFDYWQSA